MGFLATSEAPAPFILTSRSHTFAGRLFSNKVLPKKNIICQAVAGVSSSMVLTHESKLLIDYPCNLQCPEQRNFEVTWTKTRRKPIPIFIRRFVAGKNCLFNNQGLSNGIVICLTNIHTQQTNTHTQRNTRQHKEGNKQSCPFCPSVVS